jgi:hypothetical protein
LRIKKRIRLDGTLENKAIKSRQWYLAHTDFGWQLGRFTREWFGLCLEVPLSEVVHHQLDDIDDLYEVTLPKLRKQPTQSSLVMKQRKKEGLCLQCGAKGTPGYPHSRSCKNNPDLDEDEEY